MLCLQQTLNLRLFAAIVNLWLCLSLLVESFSTTFSSRPTVATYFLVDKASKQLLGSCYQLEPLLLETAEDEVDEYYPTSRKAYVFDQPKPTTKNNASSNAANQTANNSSNKREISVRRTSFGCSKLGYTVWPASLVLSLDMVARTGDYEGKRILELGAGVGLPSVVAGKVVGASAILATDHWLNDDAEAFDDKRLIPTPYHEMNLRFNVQSENSSIRNVDWHDIESVRAA